MLHCPGQVLGICDALFQTVRFFCWKAFPANFDCWKSLAQFSAEICALSGQENGGLEIQEDVDGEKLTVKKWWIFGADFSRFTQSFSRFIRDINGEKKTSRY